MWKLILKEPNNIKTGTFNLFFAQESQRKLKEPIHRWQWYFQQRSWYERKWRHLSLVPSSRRKFYVAMKDDFRYPEQWWKLETRSVEFWRGGSGYSAHAHWMTVPGRSSIFQKLGIEKCPNCYCKNSPSWIELYWKWWLCQLQDSQDLMITRHWRPQVVDRQL